METNDSRSLNWKTCFKKILAPHLLTPSNCEQQNNETDAKRTILNPVNSLDSLTTSIDLNKSETVQKDITLPIMKESVQTGENSRPFFHGSRQVRYRDFDFPEGNLNDLGNPSETEENVTSIITAHAEELAKNFKAFKVTKKKKHKTESNRSVPDWNTAFKKVFSPEPVPETVKSRNIADSSYSEMLDPSLSNPWAFHTLSKKDFLQPEPKGEAPEQSFTVDSNKKKHYTRKEKEVLELLRLSGSFKRWEKPHMNIFDGAGVNCFKDSESKSLTKSI